MRRIREKGVKLGAPAELFKEATDHASALIILYNWQQSEDGKKTAQERIRDNEKRYFRELRFIDWYLRVGLEGRHPTFTLRKFLHKAMKYLREGTVADYVLDRLHKMEEGAMTSGRYRRR